MHCQEKYNLIWGLNRTSGMHGRGTTIRLTGAAALQDCANGRWHATRGSVRVEAVVIRNSCIYHVDQPFQPCHLCHPPLLFLCLNLTKTCNGGNS